MRIFLLADGFVGTQVASYLREEGEDIVGLALHPKSIRKYGSEIVATAGVPEEQAILAKELSDSAVIDQIRRLEPEIMLSVFWGYILKPEVFRIPAAGCINFHCSYLPYNRGKNPNVWPIIEGTPAGITLHYIDEGIDTGNVIARKRIDVTPVDTAQTIYERQIAAFLPLFRETWPSIRAGKNQSVEQDPTLATFHFKILQNGCDDNPEYFNKVIGTGPFTVEEFTPGVRSIAKRNPNYWRDGPNVDEIELFGPADFRRTRATETYRRNPAGTN